MFAKAGRKNTITEIRRWIKAKVKNLCAIVVRDFNPELGLRWAPRHDHSA